MCIPTLRVQITASADRNDVCEMTVDSKTARSLESLSKFPCILCSMNRTSLHLAAQIHCMQAVGVVPQRREGKAYAFLLTLYNCVLLK